MTFYRAAASHGSALAEYNLGVLYEEGLGVAPDRAEATLWYKRAIANSNATVRSLATTRLTGMTEKRSEQAADE